MAYVYIYIIAYITYMCPGPAAVRLSVCGPCLEALSLSLSLSLSRRSRSTHAMRLATARPALQSCSQKSG